MKRHILLGVLIAAAVLGCGDAKNGTEPGSDTTPPGLVTNFRVDRVEGQSVTLAWTAPGNDGSVGTAHRYDLRYSINPITEGGWEASTPMSEPPDPAIAGAGQVATLVGLQGGVQYFFALRTADEVPNWSGLSNVVSAVISGTLVNVSPRTANVQVNLTQQFTAAVAGTGSQEVAWLVEGGAGKGTISASGLYTAPSAVPSPATVTVRATSLADNTESATATVTVTPALEVVVKIRDTTYIPSNVTINLNKSVEWQNWSRDSRTVTSGTGPGDPAAGELLDVRLDGYPNGQAIGGRHRHQFTEVGTFSFFSREVPAGYTGVFLGVITVTP